MGERTLLSVEGVNNMRQGISMVLSKWSSLRMAVDCEWGGPQSNNRSLQLCDQILLWFTHSRETLYIDDLEDILDEAMLSSFNTEIDDGSIEEVAEKLMIMHEECLEGNFTSIDMLREVDAHRVILPHVRQDLLNDNATNMAMEPQNGPSNSNPVSMQVDEPGPVLQTLEEKDGWVVVGSRKKNKSTIK